MSQVGQISASESRQNFSFALLQQFWYLHELIKPSWMIFLLFTGTSALIIYISNIQRTQKYVQLCTIHTSALYIDCFAVYYQPNQQFYLHPHHYTISYQIIHLPLWNKSRSSKTAEAKIPGATAVWRHIFKVQKQAQNDSLYCTDELSTSNGCTEIDWYVK